MLEFVVDCYCSYWVTYLSNGKREREKERERGMNGETKRQRRGRAKLGLGSIVAI
jgi:hypothetical protein